MKKLQFILVLLFISYSTIMKAQIYPKATDLKGLEIGVKAPVFSALNQDSVMFSLETALEKGPVVVIFYRGFWCPYCTKHLKSLQDSLQLIYDKGASVIAISPEKPEYLQKMEDKTGAKFMLLYDEGYKISDAYGATFRPDNGTILKYKLAGINLKETHSDETERLPIPATYIINKEGVIIWRHFDPDYKNRSSVTDIINAIK
jgi:peroxiredoxin